MPISRIETASLAAGLVAPSATTATTATALTTASGSAPSYSARAWVNFDGTGTVAIRASGNVTSITDNGVGDYTVNFTTAMSDVNYCSLATGTGQVNVSIDGYANIRDPAANKLVGSVRVQQVTSNGSPYDTPNMNVAIFR